MPALAKRHLVAMTFIDAAIPLAIGLLLVTRPQAFTKRQGADAQPVYATLRKLGYVLIAVGVLFGVLAIVRT